MNPANAIPRLLWFLRPTTLALALMPLVSSVSAVEFISNGSFETGKAIPLNWNGGLGGYVGVNLSSGPSNTDLPGWSGSFTSWYDINNCDYMSGQDGVRWINLVSLGGAALSQSFAVTAGRVYTVSYYEKRRGGGGYMDTTVSVAAGTVTGAAGSPTAVVAGPAASIVQLSARNNDAWTAHTFTFTPNTTTTATLSFTNDPAGDNDGIYLDNVSVTAPAIPGTTSSTVAAIPITVGNDGISTATITVTLKDSSNNLAVGKTVTLASSRGATDTILPASGISDTNGVVTFTVKSTTAGPAIFTATDTTDGIVIAQTATVTFAAGAPDPTRSTMTASPTSVTANGASTSTVTVTLLTRTNAPVPGKTVTLASNRGSTDTISAASGSSSASGVVTFTVKSTTAGSAIFTATDTTDVMVVAQTAAVTFTPTSVSATNSIVTASPASVAADGVATTTISVTLRDAFNNPVSGKTVTLTSSRPTQDTISAASGASTTSGLVTFTVTSVSSGSSVFTATDVTDGNLVLTPTTTVAFTKSSAKTILSCSFGTLGAATISGTNISIHVPASQPVTNLAPTFTVSPAATLSPASGSANNFSSPVTYTVTAQDGSTQPYLVSVLSYAAWSNSASLYILTTANGANLPAGASETNFPVLVRLNANNFNFSQAKTNGEDIRFEAADGAPLSYQIEQWDATGGTASIWVRIPVIQGNTNQQIRMYWGKADAASESSGPAVFNATNGYACVMHLSDPVNPVKDDVGNLTPTDYGTTSAAGMIANGRNFFAPNQGVDCGRNLTALPAGGSPHSTTVWLRPEKGATGWRVLVWGIGVLMDPAPPHSFLAGSIASSTDVSYSQWYHLALTYENGQQRLYLNGALDSSTVSTLAIPNPLDFMILGGQIPGAWHYSGGMDEVRISKVARSANWIKLEYANQKPLQTLMGSLVQPGTSFSVSPASVTLNEGATTNIVAQAGGAIKVSWVKKVGTQETVVANDQLSLNFAAGRVVGDQSFTLSFRAVYLSGDVVTRDIPVTIQEAVPDPVYTLTAPSAWDGRQTITVTPDISNWSALQAAGATNLTFNWSVAGLAVIKQINPGSLTLTRAQGSGPLTVTLVLDNGGVPVTQSKTITVQEPATDAWVQRTPDPNEKPVTHQFFARDGTTGKGTIHYNGTQAGATAVFLKVYAMPESGPETQYGTTLRQTLTAGGAYAFTVPIDAGLVKYRVEFGTRSGSTDTVTATVTDLVCGDAYLINGQSNAVAYNYGNFTDLTNYTYTSTWIRSFGTHGEGGQGSELNGGWGNADQINEFGGGIRFVGYWGMYIAKQLVDNYQIPICILQGAVGGTRIDQHMPNATAHADPATIYGRLLRRVQAANLTHGIRGVLWHQGESDSGSDGPDGDNAYKFYRQYFVDLSAAWKQDYPNIRYYYTFQVWPKPCEMGPYGDQIREIQRTLPNMYSNLRVMSTVGVYPEVWCHTDLNGYVRFGELLGSLIEQDNYGYVPTTPITAPDLKRAYFTTTNRTEIALEFGQNVAWNNGSAGLIFLDGVGGKVTSGSVSGNVIKLQVTGASTSQTISYLMDQVWDRSQANLIYGTNGIAALTFSEVPLAMSALLAPTGLNAVPNSNQVVLNWTASSGATGYKVKRALSSGGTYAVIGTPSGTTYTDTTGTNGTTYYYVVSATSGTDESLDSAVASATIHVIGTGVTTTTLARHSGTGSSSTYGDALSFDVTVSGSSTPTGTVTLKDGGAGGTAIGSATLAGGACTITTAALTTGSHANIVAVYAGDSTFASSTSGALSPAQTVNKATPVVAVTGSTSFTYNASAQGPNTATTGGSTGAVTFSYVGVGGTTYPASGTAPTHVGSYTCTATVAADSNYLSASSGATPFAIAKATPVITWVNPQPINVGTALGTTQLNATSGGVAGNFVYSPASGTQLALGSHVLSVQFTPTVTANYNTPAAKTVTLQVQPASSFNITVDSHNGDYPYYGASATDLINAGQSTLASLTLNPGSVQWDTLLVNLNDGMDPGGLGWTGFGPTDGAVVTAVLNTGAGGNTTGYDITSIISLTSNSDPTDRISQKYDVAYHVVGGGATWTTVSGDAGATVARAWPYGPIGGTGGDLRGEMKVTIAGMTLTSVDQLRFTFHNFPNTAVWREIDVFGTATVAASNNYAAWAAAQNPPLGAANVVGPDGLANLLIYALAGLKTDHANGSPGTLIGKLLSFTKRPEAVANNDVTYMIETSPDLGVTPWTAVGAGDPALTNTDTVISYTLPDGVSGGKIFARLKVSQ